MIEQILEREARSMGRSVTLVSASTLADPAGDITTVVYDCEPLLTGLTTGRVQYERRVTVWIDGVQKMSAIVSSKTAPFEFEAS